MSSNIFFKRYTLDGEAVVQSDDKEEVIHPLKTANVYILPPWFKEEHLIEIKLFHSLVTTIKKDRPNRQVPVTRTEFIRAGGNQRILDQLVKAGVLAVSIVPITIKGENKNTGSRSCVYYTPEGRALVREKLDPQYALKEEGRYNEL